MVGRRVQGVVGWRVSLGWWEGGCRSFGMEDVGGLHRVVGWRVGPPGGRGLQEGVSRREGSPGLQG